MTPAEGVGSVGVLLLLVAFAANAFGYTTPERPAYHAANLVGASLSCAASAMIGFVPFVVLEGTWALVAGVALARLMARRAG
ncbi:MAG: hypothetical protein ABMA64_24615 [Myxococcota bacterium]|jgi:hypothetical protein